MAVGERGGKTKPHEALIHPFIYSPSLPSYFQYQIFNPMVNKVMLKHRINHQRYDMLICRIVKVSHPYTDASRFSQKDTKPIDSMHISNMLPPAFMSMCSLFLASCPVRPKTL